MLRCARLFVTPSTAVQQAHLSLGFPGKNTGVGWHFLPQGLFLAWEPNPLLHVLHWQVDSLIQIFK